MFVTLEIGFRQGDEEGKMKASIDLPEGEVTVTQLLPVLQGLTSRIVNGVTEGTGTQISCKAGCGACCRQVVPISVYEAEGLATWIRGLPADQQAMIEERFAQTVEELREKGLLQRLQTVGWDAKSEATRDLALDFLRAGVACPFLVNESCAIHPIRPLICREYVVVSPAEYCSAPWLNQVVGVTVPVQLSHALRRLAARMEGADEGWLPLVLLLEWMRAGAAPGEKVKGTGQEVVRRVLGELQG